jgi:hypothetical protein
MSECTECGSKKAYWMVRDKENKAAYYCDPCFKKNDLAEHKKEMDEYHKKKKEMDEYHEKKKEMDNVTSWPTLLSSMLEIKNSVKEATAENPMLASSLFENFAHQVIYVFLTGKLNEPEYFQSIPFGQIMPKMVARATRYVENPPVPALVKALYGDLPTDRYQITPEGAGRQTFPPIDGLIIQVASCLPRENITLNDETLMGKLAYQAVRHYAGLPIVNYFFCLPYLDKAKDTKTISPQEAELTTYKGVEGLLLEIYEQLGEGQVITDPLVTGKVKDLISD